MPIKKSTLTVSYDHDHDGGCNNFVHQCYTYSTRFFSYQHGLHGYWGNQISWIEEEQAPQWPKEKVKKDKQQSTTDT